MMMINNSASPMAFRSTWRNGGVNICAKALMAASIMPSQLMLTAVRSKTGVAQEAGVSVSVCAGTSDTSSSASTAGMSAQAIAL